MDLNTTRDVINEVNTNEKTIDIEDVVKIFKKELPRIMSNSSDLTDHNDLNDLSDQSDMNDPSDMNDQSDGISSDLSDLNDGISSDVISMIKFLEKGEEPLMLKICAGRASSGEISEWAASQGIHEDDIEEILSMMGSSFLVGSDMAKDMELDQIHELIQESNHESNHESKPESKQDSKPDSKQDSKQDSHIDDMVVLEKLKTVLCRLDGLKIEVVDLMNYINPPSVRSYYPYIPHDPNNYTQYM